jgi:hypothetical protein
MYIKLFIAHMSQFSTDVKIEIMKFYLSIHNSTNSRHELNDERNYVAYRNYLRIWFSSIQVIKFAYTEIYEKMCASRLYDDWNSTIIQKDRDISIASFEKRSISKTFVNNDELNSRNWRISHARIDFRKCFKSF